MDEIIGVVFAWVFALTGRTLIRALTFGRWQCEPFSGSQESRIHSAAGSLSYLHKGRRTVTATGTMLAGFALYFAIAAAFVAWLAK